MWSTPAKVITCDFGFLWPRVIGMVKSVLVIVKVILYLVNKNSGIISVLSSLIHDGILLVTVKVFDYSIDYVGVSMT
jgi:hypothetical protein